MTAMEPSTLALFWAGVIAVAIVVYVILDGFDLGVGILFGTTSDQALRNEMMDAISPFWDGNETWLVIIGASLFAAFPVVYAVFLPAFYIPVLLLLFGLIFRGVAFEFRYRARCARAMGLGLLRRLDDRRLRAGRGGRRDDPRHPGRERPVCRRPLRVAGALAGAERHRPRARLCAARRRLARAEVRGRAARLGVAEVPRLAGAVLVVLALAAVASIVERDRAIGAVLLDRAWGLVFPALGLLAMVGVFAGVRRRRDAWPFAMTVLFFLAAFATLAVMFWPYMIPYSITVGNAAAPEASLSFLFWGAGVFVLPVIAIYTAVVYWVFRGKLRHGYRS